MGGRVNAARHGDATIPTIVAAPSGGGIPPKSTTMYVGRIPASLSDETLQGVLQACGEVQSWKPTLDPDTGKSKGFGFVSFVLAEGVITTLRVLHDREIDGQKLIVKTNKVGWMAGAL